MRDIDIGLRIGLESGLIPFGTEEVNDLIRRGGRVVALEPGGAIMRKLGEDSGNVRLTLSGFSIKVRVEEADSAFCEAADVTTEGSKSTDESTRRGR